MPFVSFLSIILSKAVEKYKGKQAAECSIMVFKVWGLIAIRVCMAYVQMTKHYLILLKIPGFGQFL